jgi:diadenosine tetraphosphatase ApaH/serine/threonine PP2A family protein phosphatase
MMGLFDSLPICAIVDEKYFAVHAGISPSCRSIEDIQRIHRFMEVPCEGGMCDLLWSDPAEESIDCWMPNSNRNCSYYFGGNQVRKFLNFNHLKMMFRGHEVNGEGFKYQKLGEQTVSITVFSAPNYSEHNKACVACIEVCSRLSRIIMLS